MIYKDFYCVFTVESQDLAEKWVNSIKLVQDEIKAEGALDTAVDEDNDTSLLRKSKSTVLAARYAKLAVYQKVTGKSTFKDYVVLMEAFEKKEMLKLFIRGMMYLEDQRTKSNRSALPKNELFQQYSKILALKIKAY